MDLPKLYLLETEREREREELKLVELKNLISFPNSFYYTSFYTRFRRLAEKASNS